MVCTKTWQIAVVVSWARTLGEMTSGARARDLHCFHLSSWGGGGSERERAISPLSLGAHVPPSRRSFGIVSPSGEREGELGWLHIMTAERGDT